MSRKKSKRLSTAGFLTVMFNISVLNSWFVPLNGNEQVPGLLTSKSGGRPEDGASALG